MAHRAVPSQLGLPVIAIQSMHKQADREMAMERFNDPDDAARILVTSHKVSGVSANLQGECRAVLFHDTC